MKCPFKMLKAPYDGGAECDKECALAMSYEFRGKTYRNCAIAVAAQAIDVLNDECNDSMYGITYVEEGE